MLEDVLSDIASFKKGDDDLYYASRVLIWVSDMTKMWLFWLGKTARFRREASLPREDLLVGGRGGWQGCPLRGRDLQWLHCHRQVFPWSLGQTGGNRWIIRLGWWGSRWPCGCARWWACPARDGYTREALCRLSLGQQGHQCALQV